MALSLDQKTAIIGNFHRNDKDTGSPEVQIAIFTERINLITEHLKTNAKDNASRLGLLKLVGKRRRLMRYLKRTQRAKYNSVIATLQIRDNL